MEEARAFRDGIDFYLPKKKLVISARRDFDGEVTVTKHTNRSEITHPVQTLQLIVVVIVCAAVLSILLMHISIPQLRTVITLAVMWLGSFAYYFYKSKCKEEYSSYRYHAAEHKALNYLDRYQEAPLDVYFLKNTSSYSVRCGSTMIAVVCSLITLVTLSITFLPFTWLKVIGCVLSLVVVFFLWALDLLNFFQKFVIIEPTIEEVEVAYEGLKEYVKELKAEDENGKTSSV